MTPQEALRDYDLLWAELRSLRTATGQHTRGRKVCVVTRSRADIIARMIEHCRAAFALYESKRGTPEYDDWRAAMWLRRWHLHRAGKTDRVYSDNNPSEWRERYEQGGGVLP